MLDQHYLILEQIKRILFPFSFIGILVMVFMVYSPGLSGKFALDDGVNILQNSAIAIKKLDIDSIRDAAFSGRGGLKRPISMLSFALNYWVKGFDPYYFKLTNVFIHLLNGVLVFVLVQQVLKIYQSRFQPQLQNNYLQWVSLAVASAWLLHPLCMTSVLYVVQRMTSLSALFTFAGLNFYLRGRFKLLKGESGGITKMLAGFLVFLPLATLSKENGILLPIFMFVFEITLFNFEVATAAAKKFLIGFYGVTIVLPGIFVILYLASHTDFVLNGYKLRDFTLMERLLTEPRILWIYLKMILLPRSEDMGLFHDDIAISHSLFEPVSTFIAVLLLLALCIIGFLSRKRYPIVALGLLFFFSGHLLESTIFSLEITFEHRNYVPMVGIILIVAYYLLYPLANQKSLRFRQAAMISLIGILAAGTAIRASHWGNLFLLSATEVAYHPNSYRAHAEMGAMYGILAGSEPDHSDEYYQLSREHFEKSADLNKNSSDALFGLISYSSKLKRKIESKWIENLVWRMKYTPFILSNADRLFQLESCFEAGECKLSKADMRGLLDAAMQNATLDAEPKARLLTTYCFYFANVEHDDKNALKAIQDAVKAFPSNPNYRANLINYLISRNQVVEARKELVIAKKLDLYGTYKRQFSEQEQLLNVVNLKK